MSAGKIFWRIIRHAAAMSGERFKTFGEIVTNIIYVIGAAVVFRLTTKELGDTVIYWALSIPPLLWCIYFVWHSVKYFHRISPRTFPIIVVILLFISASFGMLCMIQISSNAKLKKELNPPKQIAIAPKPMSVKTIPRPEPPPTPAPIISAQQVAVVETQQQFETFGSGDGKTNDFSEIESSLEAIKQIKRENAEKEAKDRQDLLLAVKTRWDLYLPHYQRLLVVLHDALSKKALEEGDGISQSEGYFQSLPTSISTDTKEFKVAEIRFQKKTNMDFVVTISALNGISRQMQINCAAGHYITDYGSGEAYHGTVDLRLDEEITDPITAPLEEANTRMTAAVDRLIAGQEFHLMQNK